MNNLMIFEGKQVEVFEFKGNALFNPKDVGKCLDLSESAVRMAIGKMNKNQVIKLTNSDVKDIDIRKLNNAGENFLKEAGVYKLAFKSRKESAERFQDWVADEVLPQIRKTGGYIPHDEDMTDEEIMARALLVAQKTIEEKSKLLEDAKKEIAEKDRVITQISISQNTKLVRETAKAISKSNSKILIGERRLYERLRSWGWVCKNSTEATQYAVERGYLEVSEGTKKTARGTFTFRTTRVTGKGEIKIIEKLLKEKDLEKLLEENEKSK